MLETVRDKLRNIYDAFLGRPSTILDIFIEQFGERNVDSDITTFDQFVDSLASMTMGSLGITDLSASNNYGHYTIDRADYEANGRGKSILEYAPDLGIFDYLTPKLKTKLNLSSSYQIIVHFPAVRVTNEFDKYIDINDLYAKIQITPLGLASQRFTMLRSTYTFEQFKSGYAHSHLPRISKYSIDSWQYPCLGSGPISRTQDSLTANYDTNLWGLFAFELSKYVTVESIVGIPYIRLESVGKSSAKALGDNLQYASKRYLRGIIGFMLDRFIKFYANSGKFKVKFVDGQYHLGENINSFCISASNTFIQWYNDTVPHEPGFPCIENLLTCNLIDHYIVSNGFIYYKGAYVSSLSDAQEVEGTELFKFKGEPVKLHIILNQESTNNDCLLFTEGTCAYIITKLLNTLNYKYGKRNANKRKGEAIEPCKKPYVI